MEYLNGMELCVKKNTQLQWHLYDRVEDNNNLAAQPVAIHEQPNPKADVFSFVALVYTKAHLQPASLPLQEMRFCTLTLKLLSAQMPLLHRFRHVLEVMLNMRKLYQACSRTGGIAG